MDVSLRFRLVQDYAVRNGFVGGIPTYFNATYNNRVYGAIMLPAATADWLDVPASELAISPGMDFGAQMRAAHDYAGKHNYVGAIPTFFEGSANGVIVHGVFLLKQGTAIFRDVTAEELGKPPDNDIGARFRAAQTYATAPAQQMVGAFPNFYQAPRNLLTPRGPLHTTVYGHLLFPPGTAEWRDVPAEKFGPGSLDDPANRMRLLQPYAKAQNFVGAFPNFFQADGPGLVYGAVLVAAAAAQHQDVPVKKLGNPPDGDDAALFRGAQDYAKSQSKVGAFPTFYRAGTDAATVYGVVLLEPTAAEWRDVPVDKLGKPDPADGPARFRAANTYATANTAVGGFPTFYEAPQPTGTVNGTILLRGPSVVFRDIPADDLFPTTVVGGAIRVKWKALGGGASFLGAPLTPELPCADGVGRFNVFEGGVIYFTPASLCFEVHGGILDKWNRLGAERSWLGYPVSDEGPWTDPSGKPGRISTYERGAIAWLDGPIVLPQSVTTPAAVITTPDGTALGGSVTCTVRSDGTYQFDYHLHDSGAVGYDFSIRAAFAATNGIVLIDTFGGSVAGTFGKGSRDANQSNPGADPRIAANWTAFQKGTLGVSKDYGAAGIAGLFVDVEKFILDAEVGAGSLVVGMVIGAASVIGSLLPSLGPGQTFGVIAGFIVMNTGAGLVLAAVEGVAVGAATDALIATRTLNANEIALATLVFENTIPLDRVRITNLNLTGRPFTAPGADGLIYISVGGAGYKDASVYTDPNKGYTVQGQILAHELTHAWQMVNSSFLPGVVCLGIVTQFNRELGEDVYNVAPAGPAWSEFGIESQAALVDKWFAKNYPNYPTLPPPPLPDPSDPYFRYIRDNIRARKG
jgi:hypothetical protein